MNLSPNEKARKELNISVFKTQRLDQDGIRISQAILENRQLLSFSECGCIVFERRSNPTGKDIFDLIIERS
jgi:hypothetical protein